jgi:L-rhamnose isomerase/sugar isomerase
MLGSICHPSAEVRDKAIAAIIECCRIADEMDAPAVKVWLGDGTNYPGQDDLRWRRNRLVEGLQQVYEHLPASARMLLEYKIFEPAFYSTDVQDWGQSLAVCNRLGDRAVVCVDTGHHSLGVNIEQIVAILLAEGRLGAFDLNDKKYGDDDLMVGSIDPYQMFRITHELINAMRDDSDPAAQQTAIDTVYMLDQCHNIEPKVPAIVRSVQTLQELFAKALLVDRDALVAAQARGDILAANNLLWSAFFTDVRGPLAELRQERGLPAEPFAEYLASGEDEQRSAERIGGDAASSKAHR